MGCTHMIQVGIAGIGPVGAILVLRLEIDEVTGQFATADRDQLTGAFVRAPLTRSFEIGVVLHSTAVQLALTTKRWEK